MLKKLLPLLILLFSNYVFAVCDGVDPFADLIAGCQDNYTTEDGQHSLSQSLDDETLLQPEAASQEEIDALNILGADNDETSSDDLISPAYQSIKSIHNEEVYLQILNKLSTKYIRIRSPIKKEINFETLTIMVSSCQEWPPEVPPESGAFIEIFNSKNKGSDNERKEKIYSGWMFASSPSLTPLKNPIYDVTILDCLRVGEEKKELIQTSISIDNLILPPKKPNT